MYNLQIVDNNKKKAWTTTNYDGYNLPSHKCNSCMEIVTFYYYSLHSNDYLGKKKKKSKKKNSKSSKKKAKGKSSKKGE